MILQFLQGRLIHSNRVKLFPLSNFSSLPLSTHPSRRGLLLRFKPRPILFFLNKICLNSVRNGPPSACPRRITFHAGGLNSKVTCPPDGQLFQSFIKLPRLYLRAARLVLLKQRQQRFCALVPSTKLLYTSIKEWCEWYDGDRLGWG